MKIEVSHLRFPSYESRLSEIHGCNKKIVYPNTYFIYTCQGLHTKKWHTSKSTIPITPTLTPVFINASTATNNGWTTDHIPPSSTSVYRVEEPFPSLKFRQSSITYRQP